MERCVLHLIGQLGATLHCYNTQCSSSRCFRKRMTLKIACIRFKNNFILFQFKACVKRVFFRIAKITIFASTGSFCMRTGKRIIHGTS